MSEEDTGDDEAATAADVQETASDAGSGNGEGDAGGATAVDPDAPAFVRALQRLNQALGTGELGLLSLVLILLVLVGSFAAVLGIAGKTPGTWPKEIIKYSVFFVAMIGASLAASRQQLIAMDIVGRFAPPRIRAWIRATTNLFASGISIALLVRALDVSKVEMKSNVPYDIVSPGLGSLILPIGAGLIATHLAIHMLVDLSYLVRGKVAPESNEIKVH